ncbi:MAG: hypothetical protein AB7O49_07925 [Sphingomonadales bacterium]
MAVDNEPPSHRPEPMASNRPKSRTVTIVALLVGGVIVAICIAVLIGVFQAPAWTQS